MHFSPLTLPARMVASKGSRKSSRKGEVATAARNGSDVAADDSHNGNNHSSNGNGVTKRNGGDKAAAAGAAAADSSVTRAVPMHDLYQIELKDKAKVDHYLPKYPYGSKEHQEACYAHIKKYANTSYTRGLLEFAFTAAGFLFLLWQQWWILFPIAAGFRVRLFIIMHDAAHFSLLPSDKANNLFAGFFMPFFTFTPSRLWQRGHNHHHKNVNNLDDRKPTITAPWTIEKYVSVPRWVQNLYAFMLGPVGILSSISPTLFFLLVQQQRIKWWELLIEATWAFFSIYLGVWRYDIATYCLGAIFGVFLFHAQHTFEGCIRKRTENWSYFDAQYFGSSYLRLPWYCSWATFGIEYHHIHHLNTRVPGYKLWQCHAEGGKDIFGGIHEISLKEAYDMLWLSLYDEDHDKFVSPNSKWVLAAFEDAAADKAAAAAGKANKSKGSSATAKTGSGKSNK